MKPMEVFNSDRQELGKQAELWWIPISELTTHPSNPRIGRPDKLDSIIESMRTEGYRTEKPMLVRPHNEKYQIIGGHSRYLAAHEVGIDLVLCAVEKMTDEEAILRLAADNVNDPFSWYSVCIYVVQNSVKASKKGLSRVQLIQAATGKGGVAAEQEAKNKGMAGEVLLSLIEQTVHVYSLLDPEINKTRHLAALHALPESTWPEAVQTMLSKGWSAKETGEQVKAAQAGSTDKRKIALLSGKTSTRELARIDQLRFQVSGSLEFEDIREEWMNWLDENDPTDIKQVQAKRIELEDKEAERRASQEDKEDETSLPNLILADPPWRYDFAQSDSRQIENQYPSASVEEIIAHRPDTAPDCVLFLWATVAKLPQAMEVMEGWGFEYKTHAVWDKEKIGMGYWFRGQHELLLVGTRGKAEPPDEEFRVSSVFREKRNKHSAKPDCIYEWIEKAFPEANKLEMYCRSPRTGWLVFGNESKEAAA